MSTYKTKNPLGSAAVKDLYDNAENVDKFVNDRTKEELEDRLGVLRKTWHGMEMIFSRFIDYITGRGEQAVAAIGWQELGNWAVGLAVDNRQQIVYYNGSWYKYLGELEHVIAGDSPENDGGVWSAANPTGKWSNIGDAALRSNLGSGEPGMGASLSALEQGGTVQDALVCVYVDGFGADPSGETDSTDAVLRAVKTVATLLTSGYDNTNSKYAVVVFGNGTYVIGDVPFFSGIRYVGQGEYATRIQPKPGAQYCFTTVGTKNIDQAASASDRLFYSGVCRMSIGCGYQTANTPNYTEPPENVGGIFVKSASYMRFEHLDIRFLDGCGIDAVELFDSDIRHVKMMSVGNARDTSSIESIVPALRLMPDGDYSSTNAVRIHALHIEECAKHMHIGKRTRHVFFTGGCKFEGAPDTNSSTITGVHNVTFSSPELTWQRSDIPMFEMAAGFEGINSSYGIVLALLNKSNFC